MYLQHDPFWIDEDGVPFEAAQPVAKLRFSSFASYTNLRCAPEQSPQTPQSGPEF